MRTFHLSLAAAVWMAIGVGCASGGSPQSESGPSESPQGAFQFRETVANTTPRVVLEGRITILPDTITAELTGAPCQSAPYNQSPTLAVFDCLGTVLTVDRRHPANRTRYSLMTTVTVAERVCTRYQVDDSSGVRWCVEWRTENRQIEERREGTLSLHHVS